MSADEFWSVFSLDNQREYCRGGDKRALIRTIAVCCKFNVKPPAWAREAIFKAWLSPPKSWDDVFGRPLPKGKSIKAQQRRQRIAMQVIPRVKELHAKSEPIDIALFEKVAEEFGVKPGTARDIYYDNVGTFDLLNDPDAFYNKLYELLKAEKAKF
jgi:hypothetical protein